MIESIGDFVGVLESADPEKKAALYESLGLNLIYELSRRRVPVEADSEVHVRLVSEGGLEPPRP